MLALDLVRSNFKAAFRPLNIWDPAGRHNELDGLRGWAALSVLLLHQFYQIYGLFNHMNWALDNFAVNFICDGHFAVNIFFIVSGEALTSSFFNYNSELLTIKLIIKRYLRLVIPILFASFTCLLVSRLSIVQDDPIEKLTRLSSWATRLISVPKDIHFYIKYIFHDVFNRIDLSNNNDSARYVIPYLWTMHYELIGSYLVLFACIVIKYIKYFWIIFISIAILLCASKEGGLYSCFIFGCWFSYLRSLGFFYRAQDRWGKFAPFALLAIAAAEGYCNWRGILWDRKEIFAVPFVFAMWCSKPMCEFLKNGVSRMLGVLSFPVYLIQYPVILTYLTWAVLTATHFTPLTPIVVTALGFSSILMSYLAAALFVPVEVFTKWVGNQTVRLLVIDRKK